MNHTAEEVREHAKFLREYMLNGITDPAPELRWKHQDKIAAMLTAYAGLLERSPRVTDYVITRALSAYDSEVKWSSELTPNGRMRCRMRAALLAVWPVAAEPVGKLSDMPIGSTIRCRKCGEQTAIAFNYAGGTGECCNHSPCAHPGVGPCDRPAEPVQPADSGRVMAEPLRPGYVRCQKCDAQMGGYGYGEFPKLCPVCQDAPQSGDVRRWHTDAALAAQGQPAEPVAQGEMSAEDRFEQYVQSAIDSSPEPLRRLGEFLANHLDDDKFPTAERLLLAIATQPRAVPAERIHPIATDDDVENLAALCDWNNRRYMTPADYSIWCQRMRKFVSLATQPAERVPEGWMLVPIKATGDMILAGIHENLSDSGPNVFGRIWASMLAAAPQPGEPQ